MKKLFILTCLLFAIMIGTEVNAQSKNVFLHQQETMDALGLNSEQQAQIKKLTAQSFNDIGKLQKDTTLTKFDRNSKTYEVYRTRDAEYQKVLTEEQWKKLVEMREAAKKQ